MLYTVFYKAPRHWFWRKLKKVKGDTVLESSQKTPLPVRVIILSDETRIEIPMTWAIKFSRDRFLSIRDKMNKEAGQKVA